MGREKERNTIERKSNDSERSPHHFPYFTFLNLGRDIVRFDERIRGRNLVDARPAPSLSIISWNDASSERNTHVPQKKGERKVRARRRHAPILLASHDALFFAIISVQPRERAFPFDEKEPLPPSPPP